MNSEAQSHKPDTSDDGGRFNRYGELERYIGHLHRRVRSLESQLGTIAQTARALANTALEWLEEAPEVEEPAGLHLLGTVERHDADDIDDEGWQVKCSCGWWSQRSTYHEEADALGGAHVRRLTA